MKKINKGNPCGVVGLCLGWLIPIAGLVLGIIALCRKENTPIIGVLSIILSVLFWLLWLVILWV